MPGSYVIVTKTRFTTVQPSSFTVNLLLPTTAIETSTTPSNSIIMSSIANSTSAPILSSVSSVAVSSSIPTPSAFLAMPGDDHATNNSLAIATLVAVAILGLVLLTLIGYMIFLRLKGECPSCTDKSIQLAKWERGEIKPLQRMPTAMQFEKGFVHDLEKRTAHHNLYEGGVVDSHSEKKYNKPTLAEKFDRLKETEALRKPFIKLNKLFKKGSREQINKAQPRHEFEASDITITSGNPHISMPESWVDYSEHADSIYDTLPPLQPVGDMDYEISNPYDGTKAYDSSSPTNLDSIALTPPANETKLGTPNNYDYPETNNAKHRRLTYPPKVYNMYHSDTALPRASVIEQAYDPVGSESYKPAALQNSSKNGQLPQVNGKPLDNSAKDDSDDEVDGILEEYQQAAWRARPARNLT